MRQASFPLKKGASYVPTRNSRPPRDAQTAADCVVLGLSQFVDSLDTSTLHRVRGTRQDWISLINSENVPFASFSICDPYQIGKKTVVLKFRLLN